MNIMSNSMRKKVAIPNPQGQESHHVIRKHTAEISRYAQNDNRMMQNAGIGMQQQRGVVLFISLIIIVAMMLTGLAIMRSIGTGTLIAANLAFQQSAQASAEHGIEIARLWLVNNTAVLTTDDYHASGYYPNWVNVSATTQVDNFDPTTYDWSNACKVKSDGSCGSSADTDNAGNTVRYVIHRLCNQAGDISGASCVKFNSANSDTCGQGTSCGANTENPSQTPLPYYRITVRTDGPKNSLAYVQAIIM